MQFAGIGLMAAAVTGIGFYAAENIRIRFEVLQLFRRMISQLQVRILQNKDPLPEALMQVGSWFEHQQKGTMKEAGRMFVRVSSRMNMEYQKTFGAIWKEDLLHLAGHMPLKEEDLRDLLELGENLGYSDRLTQEKTIAFYQEQTEASIEEIKKEMDIRMKLYRSLGAAAGLFLAVILI